MATMTRIGGLKFIRFELLAAFSIVVLFSCAQYPDILGKWKESGKPSSLEFRQDGTFRAVDDMGMVVIGEYSLKTTGRIRLEIQHEDGSTEIITGTLFSRENELILAVDGDKEAMRYERQ